MNSIKHLIVLGTIIFASAVSTSAQKPKVKIGIGVSHLYDLYEGPIDLSSTSGNVTYTVTDIDLKGLNGVYTKFDVGLGVLAELSLDAQKSILLSYTRGTLTSQQENQYATSKVNLVNASYRYYFISDKYGLKRLSVRPYSEIGIGLTSFAANRYFVADQGLFSQTSGAAMSSMLAVGVQINVSPKMQITAAPNFIVNYSDAVDGYQNRGVDIMMSSTIGVLFSL
tara:strand:- start:872 stop:1546 length:675 start_codon:yes stop_codon:yes gene_type:complete